MVEGLGFRVYMAAPAAVDGPSRGLHDPSLQSVLTPHHLLPQPGVMMPADLAALVDADQAGQPYDVFQRGPPRPPCDAARVAAVAQYGPLEGSHIVECPVGMCIVDLLAERGCGASAGPAVPVPLQRLVRRFWLTIPIQATRISDGLQALLRRITMWIVLHLLWKIMTTFC